MFDFFENIAEGIGFKLISNFSEKLIDWIKKVRANAKNNEDENNIATSGDNSQVATSGDNSQVATSGNSSKVATSGDNSQVATSGDDSQVATSGDFSKVAIEGEHSVAFVCGLDSIVKAKKGTWISLCEYKENDKGNWIPAYALSAQIGNKDYKDFKGRILKENEFYCLVHRNFYPVDLSDDIKTIKVSEKKKNGFTIIKGLSFNDYKKTVYVVKDDKFSAHGRTLKEAMNDYQYKKLRDEEVEKVVEKVKKSGKINKAQYRAITGACQYGIDKFCEEHNITAEEISLEELRPILVNDYGAEKFWRLIDGE